MKYSEEEIKFASDNYNSLSRQEIASKLGRTPLSIKNLLRRLGLKHTREEILRKQVQYNKKTTGEFTVNEKMFISNIDKITSYLLGLLWADGYLAIKNRKNSKTYRIILSLKQSDGEYIKELLQHTGKWSFCVNKSGKNIQYSFHCANTLLCQFLEENDYREKSYKSPSKILNIIPSEYHSYFYLGYLDGDGCIYTKNSDSRIIFTSGIKQEWDFLENLCAYLGCKFTITRVIRKGRDSKYSSFSLYGRSNCLLFGDFIYSDKTIGFDRKRNKYNLIKGYKFHER